MKITEVTNKPMPTVYVDMDGVLADLFNHVGAIHDVEHYNQMTDKQWEDFFQNTDAYHLFRDIPAFPTSNKLVQIVKSMFGGYRILSSPLSFDRAGSIKGKREWLAKNISDPPDSIVFEHEKFKYAKTGNVPNILIDDFRKNVTAWNAAGGIGIKYQADENSLNELVQELSKVLK